MIAQSNSAVPLDRLHGIRDRFATGGSISDFVLVVVLILVAMVILYGVMRYSVGHRNRDLNHPHKLFDRLIRTLHLGVGHRDLLRKIARDLRLEHPTVLLLSPQLLRMHANQWMSATEVVSESHRQQIDDLAAQLFSKPA